MRSQLLPLKPVQGVEFGHKLCPGVRERHPQRFPTNPGDHGLQAAETTEHGTNRHQGSADPPLLLEEDRGRGRGRLQPSN